MMADGEKTEDRELGEDKGDIMGGNQVPAAPRARESAPKMAAGEKGQDVLSAGLRPQILIACLLLTWRKRLRPVVPLTPWSTPTDATSTMCYSR